MNLSNFNDNYKRENAENFKGKEVEMVASLKQKRFNSTDNNSSEAKYSYRQQVLNAPEEVQLSFKSKTALRLLG